MGLEQGYTITILCTVDTEGYLPYYLQSQAQS